MNLGPSPNGVVDDLFGVHVHDESANIGLNQTSRTRRRSQAQTVWLARNVFQL